MRNVDKLQSQDSISLLDLSKIEVEIPPSDRIVHEDADLSLDLLLDIFFVLWLALPNSQFFGLINESVPPLILWVLVAK